jgi:hypothetical protein
MGFITKLTQIEPIIQGNYIGFFGYDFTIIYDIRIHILSIVNRLEHQE